MLAEQMVERSPAEKCGVAWSGPRESGRCWDSYRTVGFRRGHSTSESGAGEPSSLVPHYSWPSGELENVSGRSDPGGTSG